MAVLKLTGFTGEAPRISPRLLPDTGAQIARSVRLEGGEIAPYRKPYPVADLVGAVSGDVRTIYRYAGDWLYWDVPVNAVPGPVADDHLYYTGDGTPKMRVGSTVYEMALPGPAGALTAAISSGTVGALYATRLYVYTWVTDFGEESEPCPASNALNVSPGNVVTLSGFVSAPAGRNITMQRIYRSQTGTSGGTNFYFIGERAASSSNFTDAIPVDDFSEPLPSLNYNPPPDDLHSLVAMPNGMMVGLSGKELCFCEPWHPHAWPENYRLTLDSVGMSLAVTGSTLVVGTAGKPYSVTGNHPDSMVEQKLELNMPCLNPQGMVDLGYSVVYPSHDGLVKFEEGSGTSLPTGELLTRDQWLRLDPATMVCGQFYGRFFGAYEYTDGNGELQRGMVIIDLTGADGYVIESPYKPDAMFYEVESGALFMAIGTTVYEWDSKNSINDIYTWRSKAFVLPAPGNFGAILFEVDERTDLQAVIAYEDEVARITAANLATVAAGDLGGAMNGAAIHTYAVNGDRLQPLPPGPQASVNIYADGQFFASVTHAGRMQRLPSGKLYRQIEVEVTGNVAVQEVTLATTGQELRTV